MTVPSISDAKISFHTQKDWKIDWVLRVDQNHSKKCFVIIVPNPSFCSWLKQVIIVLCFSAKRFWNSRKSHLSEFYWKYSCMKLWQKDSHKWLYWIFTSGWGFCIFHLVPLCSSRKYPCPPQGRFMEIPRGRGVSKVLFFEGKYSPLQKRESTGASSLYRLDWNSKH